ncbi:MAG TPA: protein phosphatase 2C domain-containing protein [Pyrinomonadaceae bacterium]|nr:serine/threonine-protein phosphatase [Chloracidobacterium sp.]MBP9936451.1 serine/threonine-protein phosphatase [Pyrinomonadaceae bacterium]MBK9439322.1 serine/threonine-protein phosphatase [Chloracidobacterium sp.]MBL0239391.1 serine/threonine-protein phosphatase [Chloracidobacterium sp.]HQX57258.1 protein phosphatase 2C domain-containing protein [Pyrinomonadaceae bacterium]
MTENIRIQSASISDRGLSEKRPQNEDSFLEIPDCGIFAVADGVGGAQAGEVASQMAVEILGEAFTNISPNDDPEEVMRTALQQANAAIHQMSNELSQLSQMATTVVALQLDGNIATIGHVGDSRLYRLDADGTLHRETDDHSMVGEEVRAGRMTEEQAENHPSKNIISRALGAESTVIVDLKTMLVSSDSTFLLCSDGVTRHIGDLELAGILQNADDLAATCLRIKELCYERGAEDNLTAVIVKVLGIADDAPMIQSPPIALDVPAVSPAVDDEMQTIATSRSAILDGPTYEVDDDDELLELDTAELHLPPAKYSEPDVFAVGLPETPAANTWEQVADELVANSEDEYAGSSEDINVASPFTSAEPMPAEDSGQSDHSNAGIDRFAVAESRSSVLSAPASDKLEIFGANSDSSSVESSGSFGRTAASVGLLLVGSVIGLLAYHFFLVPKPQSVDLPAPTQMQSDNIPLSTFEKGRRLVDADPATYIAKVGAAPTDCEGLYLLGRAYLLSGDFMKGREALVQARTLIATADPVNRATVSTEIMLALAVTNDPEAQRNLKKEIETIKAANSTANTNVSSNRPK